MNAITITKPQITLKDDQLSTTSLDIAEFFGRSHKNVMQAIANLKCSAEFTSANFSAHVKTVAMPHGATRKDTYYEMTEQGFTILAMGFTGTKAMKFKEAYIIRFHAMQTELLQKYKQAALPETLTPAQQKQLHDAVTSIVIANYGKSRSERSKGFHHEWGAIKTAFKVAKYDQILSAKFPEVMKFVLGEYTPEVEIKQAAIEDHQIVVNKSNHQARKTLTTLLAEHYAQVHQAEAEMQKARDTAAQSLQDMDASVAALADFRRKTSDVVRDLSALS